MSDIVERLRSILSSDDQIDSTLEEAAAEIERLRTHNARLLGHNERLVERLRIWDDPGETICREAAAEIERLREWQSNCLQAEAIEVEDLKAEIRRLQEAWHGRCVVIDERAAEIEDLIVSNATLDKSNLEMRAEIERLRDVLDEEKNEGELADARLIIRAWEDKANRRADEIERLRAENWQLRQACGYPIPADKETPQNPFKCGTCDAKNAEIERLEAEAERRLGTNGRMRVELANAQSEIKRLRAELEEYACPGLKDCSQPKLDDGSCLAEATGGLCGDAAHRALGETK